MDIHSFLKVRWEIQGEVQDGYRLFSDGAVRTVTLTETLGTGWYTLAVPAPGVWRLFGPYFPSPPDADFLKMKSAREALSVRDSMIAHIAEVRNSDNRSNTEKSLPAPPWSFKYMNRRS